MTYAEIIAQIIAVLTAAAPFLRKAGEGFSEEIGKQVWQKAGTLFQKLRERLQRDSNRSAEQTLDLFVEKPEIFKEALSKELLPVLEANPEWAAEIQALLAEPSLQEIVARNGSIVEEVNMTLAGSGTQRIESDDSYVGHIKINKQ